MTNKDETNVVPFKANGSDEHDEQGDGEVKDERPSHAEIVEMLSQMDDVQYEQCREERAQRWGIRLAALDRLRKQAKVVRAYKAKKKYTDPDPNDLESKLRPILETEGILDLWLKSWDKVMAGEHRNAKMLFLIATTRLFDQGMHVAIKGPSSAGKSQIRKQVLEFFPPEDVINFTSLSEKALFWFEEDFPHKILSMGEADGLQEQVMQNSCAN